MRAVIVKEFVGFFSSLIGYIVIGIFLTLIGLFLWVFRDTSILNYNFASLDQLFAIGPLVFLFLIPAITMRSFSEEFEVGTIETLMTKPIGLWSIILGKFISASLLVVFAIIPTFLYVYSVKQLGNPLGNLDMGATIGSYLGLLLCGVTFVSIGLFASTLAKKQVVGFLFAAFLCFMFFQGFDLLGSIMSGNIELGIQKLGIYYHYQSISRGSIELRDVVYFISVIAIFLALTSYSLERLKQ